MANFFVYKGDGIGKLFLIALFNVQQAMTIFQIDFLEICRPKKLLRKSNVRIIKFLRKVIFKRSQIF